MDWEYRRARVDADGLGAFLAGRDDGCRGLSLTMPLKRAALDHADEVSDIARTAGAANTLVVGPDGRLRADNTDIPGAANAIRETYDGPLASATIWGGGATASSVLLALAGLGCRRFTLQVRDPQRAAETLEVARRHPDDLDVTVGSLGRPGRGRRAGLHHPRRGPDRAAAGGCRRGPAGVRGPLPPVADPARARPPWALPRRLVTGLDLLVHQAALQFEQFTGRPAPLAAMRVAGEFALAER